MAVDDFEIKPPSSYHSPGLLSTMVTRERRMSHSYAIASSQLRRLVSNNPDSGTPRRRNSIDERMAIPMAREDLTPVGEIEELNINIDDDKTLNNNNINNNNYYHTSSPASSSAPFAPFAPVAPVSSLAPISSPVAHSVAHSSSVANNKTLTNLINSEQPQLPNTVPFSPATLQQGSMFPIPESESIGNRFDQFTKELTGLKKLTAPDKTGMYVYVHHLTYKEKDFANKKQTVNLLENLSFYVKPREMTLILGSPGCGKTSLFKVLSGQTKESHLTGKLLFNGHPINRTNHHREIAYVDQDDIHFSNLTVKETLRFALDCKAREGITDLEKEYRVDHMLHTLGLWDQRDTLIGDEFVRGISGGQKKRVTVGINVIVGCNLMLMDEPTTGLDSSTSLELIGCIKQVVNTTNTPAMVTLLQPSSQLASLFDNLIILSKGRIIYFGPMKKALAYFEDLGFVCPKHHNPAEFFQEIVDDPERFSYLHPPKCQSSDDFVLAYRESTLYKRMIESMDNCPSGIIGNEVPVESLKDETHEKQFTLPLNKQIRYNIRRGATLMIRNIGGTATRLVQALLLGFILGTLYLRLGYSLADGSSRFGLLYFTMTSTILTSISSIGTFMHGRKVFYMQRRKRYYGTLSYFLSSVICDIPSNMIEKFAFITMIYWLTGLRSEFGRYIFTLVMFLLMDFVTNGIVKAMSSISPTPEIATVIVINEFSGALYHCTADELQPPKIIADRDFNGVQVCPITKGEDFLKTFDIHTENYFKYICMVIIIAFGLAMHVFAFIGLRYLNFQDKPKAMAVGGGHKTTRTKLGATKSKPKSKIRKMLTFRREGIELDMLGKSTADIKTISDDKKSHITPVGCYLQFSDLSYSVDVKIKDENKKKKKVQLELLKNVNGYAQPGQMLALMGPSGAGKTTLLDVLAGRKTGGHTNGEILFNGKPKTKYFHRVSCYVEQQDVLSATQTVGEAIMFSADCRLPRDTSPQKKQELYDSIIDLLNLRKVENYKIGVLGNGLSLSQRKRVNIGIEMASDAQLLFLDEPTSGLDSGEAYKVIHFVSNIAKQLNRTVICTVHQPSAAIFEKFDQLLLLKKGEVVYFGPLGHNSEDILNYCASYGLEMKPHYNPADFVLEIAEENKQIINAKTGESTLFEGPKEFLDTELYRDGCNRVRAPMMPAGYVEERFNSRYASTWRLQFRNLMVRAWRNKARRPQAYLANFSRSIILAVLMGTLFIRMGYEQVDVRSRVSLIYFSFLFAGIVAYGSIVTACEDRAIFYKEKVSGFYHTSCYLLAMLLGTLPFQLITTFLLAVPLYFISGLNTGETGGNFFFYLLIYVMTFLMYDGLALLMASLLPNQVIASVIYGVLMSMSSLFAGFMITYPSIPRAWRWMHWIDMITYPFEAAITNEFEGEFFKCTDNVGAIPVPISMTPITIKYYCPVTDGEAYLYEVYDFKISMRYINVGIIGGYYIFFVVLTYIALKFIRWQVK
ncbi:hypothetical protein SAMD00019534_098570 [Acytostelium subglobosum LB1]|uniref:hypothetical protein n=1 Tax=Acytostelium subglobosum LB1 TaxID=1410327 RepID=UPI0006452073|nr:hypothetical protein SAMD00019534_098570 [Acytostelium subglobosum LB1]GAM26682.1 hypothetical protein SAMD00019534_098570 [Acytostelium subglobosum LB1]|eukprot:XP_012750343.1 hypothetical protein SAMD00019534_098570 [Acytostelium subglobosum LB1]